MLPTASGRWILVYEGANTVSEQTFHSLQCLFYGVNFAAAPGCRCTPKKEPVAIRGYTLDARLWYACYLLAGSLRLPCLFRIYRMHRLTNLDGCFWSASSHCIWTSTNGWCGS